MKEKQIFALGFFDGIHLGHAALLHAACDLAARSGARSAVMTFDHHPDTLVSGAEVTLINSAADRSALIRRVSGIENVFFLPFTQETMRIPWRSFLEELTERQNAAGYVVGYDFRFGWKGEGTAEKLRDFCAERGLLCRVIPAVRLEGVTVSSTLIRTLLLKGDMAEAARFLGHPHLLSGVAQQGALFPAEGVLLPAPGLYNAQMSAAGAEGSFSLRVTEDRVLLPWPELSGEVQLNFTHRLSGEARP